MLHRPRAGVLRRRTLIAMFTLLAGASIALPAPATAATDPLLLVSFRYQERIEWYRHFEWTPSSGCTYTRDAQGFDQAKYRLAKPMPVRLTGTGRTRALFVSPGFQARGDVNLWREASGDQPSEGVSCDPPRIPVPSADCGIKLQPARPGYSLSYFRSTLSLSGDRETYPDPFAKCDYEGVAGPPSSFTITAKVAPSRLAALRVGRRIEIADHDSDSSDPPSNPTSYARWTETWSSSITIARVSPAAWKRAARR